MRSVATISLRTALLAALSLAVFGCDRAPTDQNAREWTPSDHDRAEEAERTARGERAPQSVAEARGSRDGGGRAADPMAIVAESTWKNQCTPCHGPMGLGDGPNGPMVGAKNLTDPSFLSSRTDAELTASISNGKGRMPKFDLPPAIVAGLVARIRAGAARAN
jgi:mono/diheme cytochrome c family protein